MISAHLLVLYVAALAVVCALPGPDMALVMQTTIARGTRHGFAAACGLATARALHVTLSACGVAALLRNAPWLFEIVRYGGAVYLAWVAVQIFRSPVFALQRADARLAAQQPLQTAYVKGLFTNLLNPKALLFCSVLLPQFVRADAGPIWAQMVELGVVLVAVCSAFDAVYTIGAARIARWLRAHPLAQTVQRWTFAAALIAFAARLSLD
ncbi:LysE family translocator [Paraburkholderia humisilvae]|uniref:Leucine efflux protein n=1 Tax=Paraburkholderia humisilvae TaxID=627669 RepID=A0A6J5EDN2_9BURK|nr:LysE family translocator [Paraburkholderia humisilvae]CAB3763302.1 Leucine efflux protein [Paraburkholderia humisilvae]